MGKRLVLLLLMVWSFTATAESVDGVMLKYMVSEPGLEPYPSRIIVTADMVRMDDGAPGGDYLLFDRQARQISSVTHEDETVLKIPFQKVEGTSPVALKRDRILNIDEKAPAISGKQPHQLKLMVNDKLCFDAVVVPGLLSDTVAALSDFKQVLAGEQGKMLNELPSELLEGCDLALHTFYPTWQLETGLAVQEWDASLKQGKLLVELDEAFKADANLFSLPPNYRHYRLP